jgi:hypothetical protein
MSNPELISGTPRESHVRFVARMMANELLMCQGLRTSEQAVAALLATQIQEGTIELSDLTPEDFANVKANHPELFIDTEGGQNA